MNELSRHIEALLLENDCVIVPGFGGFVAHATSALRVAEEERFEPPTRVIGFNPQLQLNDGLLVQSFMTVYGNSFPEATRLVERKVKLLQKQLQEEGHVELPNIGELSVSLSDSYTFHPYDHRLTTPALYGLDSFTLKELGAQPLRPLQPAAAPTRHGQNRPRRQPATLHHRRWRQSAERMAVAAVLVLAVCLSFFISTPISNTEVAQTSQAALSPAGWMAQLASESLALTPQVARTVESTAVKPAKPVSAPVVAVAPPPTAPRSPRWHLIVASVGSEKDARTLADRLVKEGHDGAQAVIGDGKMRVSIASYPTEAAAYKALGELRQKPEYQSAWVLKRK